MRRIVDDELRQALSLRAGHRARHLGRSEFEPWQRPYGDRGGSSTKPRTLASTTRRTIPRWRFSLSRRRLARLVKVPRPTHPCETSGCSSNEIARRTRRGSLMRSTTKSPTLLVAEAERMVCGDSFAESGTSVKASKRKRRRQEQTCVRGAKVADRDGRRSRAQFGSVGTSPRVGSGPVIETPPSIAGRLGSRPPSG